MRLGAIDEIDTSGDIYARPMRLEQRSSRARAITTLLLMIPIASVCLLPFGLVAAAAASAPDTLFLMAERPLSTIKIGLGLTIALLLVAYPIRGIVERIGRRQSVEIADDLVTVTEDSIWGRHIWSQSLSRYKGVAHNIRASLSGSRHELVLVHPDRRRSVLLKIADRVQQSELERLSAALQLPIVGAREIVRPGRAPSLPVKPVAAAA